MPLNRNLHNFLNAPLLLPNSGKHALIGISQNKFFGVIIARHFRR